MPYHNGGYLGPDLDDERYYGNRDVPETVTDQLGGVILTVLTFFVILIITFDFLFGGGLSQILG